MAKQRVFIAIMMAVIIMAGMFIYNRTEFVRLKDKREAIAQMILNGEIAVEGNGSIVLPEKMKSLSDSGECFLVKFENNNAIYFYEYRGILESSKGYIL